MMLRTRGSRLRPYLFSAYTPTRYSVFDSNPLMRIAAKPLPSWVEPVGVPPPTFDQDAMFLATLKVPETFTANSQC